ncbi:KAP family P-loop NTPase fold protein [Propionispira raffinosivorans]|uniref:KAP family P-loop NTPase fold protein n=1 Tax=Propionispira raffinosivorans TaxID=86959 RepID=UPI0003616F47|nr:P-loop NTPase fold protein [Propionispira raffinosivorans]
MKSKIEIISKVSKILSSISSSYNTIKNHQFYICIGVIILFFYKHFENQIFIDKIPSFNDILTNNFFMGLGTLLLFTCLFFSCIYLLPIKPFTVRVDKVLVLFPICFWSMLFVGELASSTLVRGMIFTILFLAFFLLRYGISKLKKWNEKTRKESNMRSCFKTDAPIESSADDLFKRENFYNKIAKFICNHHSTHSFVVGITGKWGSGKSSIINIVLKIVEKNTLKQDGPYIVKFNPWNYPDQKQLIEQFFNALSSRLPEDEMNIKKVLGTYFFLLEKVSILALPQIMGFSNMISYLKKFIFDKDEIQDLQKIRVQINESFQKLKFPVVVVIDDIDRLNNTELKQIFQLVKSVADFPNMIYLLSFDKEIVSKGLYSEQSSICMGQNEDIQKFGEEYLEKIVQLYFEVPLIPMMVIYKQFINEFNFLLNKKKNDDNNYKDVRTDKYFNDIWHSGMKKFLKNLRDVNRVINSFSFRYDLMENDINEIDLLTIVIFELYDFETYQCIKNNKEIFTDYFDMGVTHSQDERKKIVDTILNKSCDNKNILLQLFPQLQYIYSIPPRRYEKDYFDSCFVQRRICHPLNFELYFDLNEMEIMPSEIENILKSLSDEVLFTKHVNRLIATDKINIFLDVFSSYIGAEENFPNIDYNNIKNALSVLLREGDEISTLSDFIGKDIFGIVLRLCNKFQDQTLRNKIILEVVNHIFSDNAFKGIFSYVGVVYIFDQEHGRYDLKKDPEPEEFRTFSGTTLDELEKISLREIKKWTTDQPYSRNKNLGTLLYIWNVWINKWEKNNDIVKNYIRLYIEKDKLFIHFLSLFIYENMQVSIGYEGYNKFKVFNLQSFQVLVGEDFQSISKRIGKFNFNDLYDEQKEILTLVRNSI